MSTAISRLSENGNLQKLHDKWLKRGSCTTECEKEDVDRLRPNSFLGLFSLFGSACFLALLCYLIKLVRQYMRHIRETSQSARVESFLSFVKEKEEDAIKVEVEGK
jgi:ionotropic glutamate receptor